MFKLVDQISGPAGKMAKGLNGFGSELKHVGAETKSVGEQVKDWAAGLASAAQIVEKVGKAIVEIGKKALEFGDYVGKATQFKKVTQEGLLALEGSKKVAEITRITLEKMADNAGADTEALVGKFKELRLSGFAAQQSFDAIAASLSVAAVNGDEAGKATLDLLKSVKGNDKGLFDKSAFDAVTKAGIPIDRFKKSLAALKGVTVDQIEDLIKTGQVSADEGISAVLNTIHDRFDKGEGLGALAKKLTGGSVDGQVQVLKNSLQRLFGDSALAGPLVNALKNVNKLLSDSSETGKKLRDFLARMSEKLGDLIESVSDPGSLGAALGAIIDFVDEIDTVLSYVMPYLEAFGGSLWEGIKSAVKPLIGIWQKIFPEKGGGADSRYIAMFKTLGTVLGVVLGVIIDLVAWAVGASVAFATFASIVVAAVVHGLSMLVDGAVEAWDAITDFVEGVTDAAGDLFDDAVSIGSDFIDGLIEGIENGWDTVVETVSGLGDAIVGAVEKKLGIASPSKVMKGLGAFTAIGFAQGVESKTDLADSSLGELVSPPSLVGAGSGKSAGSGGAPSTVSIGDIVVHVPAGTSDPQGFGRAAGNEIRAQVLALIEELGLEIAPSKAA
ncbi:MAG: phage tail protein [Polyangiales bacterium]